MKSTRAARPKTEVILAPIVWEYLCVSQNNEFGKLIDKTLNKFGSDGWELVSVIQTSSDSVYFFKRPIPRDDGGPA